MTLTEHAKQALEEVARAEAALGDPAVFGDQKKLRVASMAFHQAKSVAHGASVFLSLAQAMADAKEAIASEDPEMKAMGETELARLGPELAAATEAFELLLVPPDPHDQNDVIVEIRAGAGGDEAALFAQELMRLYVRYAERHGWKANLISESKSELGGYKEVIFGVVGAGAYGALKFESGVAGAASVAANAGVTSAGRTLHGEGKSVLHVLSLFPEEAGGGGFSVSTSWTIRLTMFSRRFVSGSFARGPMAS
jgi:peptide chain release factor 1